MSDPTATQLPQQPDDPTEQEDQVATVDPDNSDSDGELDEDGGKIATIDPEAEEADVEKTAQFYDNLVEQLDGTELSTLASELLQAIRTDKSARKERDEQYAQAISRTGLGKDAGGAPAFEGGSKVVDPMLAQAAFDFAARAIKEIMPPNGPVKMFIPGKNVSPDRMKKAERKQAYMNWQFLFQMPEFRTELEKLFSQIPLGGSQFLRLVPDYAKRRRRPVPRFLGVDEVSIPYSASNFYTAERQTYHEKMTTLEFQTRVEEGMYVSDSISMVDNKPTVPSTAVAPDLTKVEQAIEKVEGKQPDGSNIDGERVVHECSIEISFKHKAEGDPDGRVPYLISLDETTSKIVSVVRNWEEKDEHYDRMQWIVEFPCLPFRGAYSVGFNQFIGSLSGSATGAVRALLDSAHIQNSQVMAKIKGRNFSGQSQRINQATILELEGGATGNDDIRSLLMPIPFPGPSPTLYQLLSFLTERGQNAIHIAMEQLASGNADMPVGTTLALIEEGMRMMAAIHLRLFHSMGYVINIVHRIDRMYITDEEVKNDVGEVLAYRSDFEGPVDCIPVADPEIFTEVQRIAQAQIVADRAVAQPDIYDRYEVEKTLLERARIQNVDRLLIQKPKPVEMNQVNENVSMALGQPVAAFPDQDHLAHITTLIDFLRSPMLGSLPIIVPTFIPAALQHLKQHIVYWYVSATNDQLHQHTKDELGEDAVSMVMKEQDPETRKELDKTLASGSAGIVKALEMQLSKLQIPQVIQQAQQILQQFQPPPPQMPADPNQQAAIQQKAQSDQQKAGLKDKELEIKNRETIIDLQERRAERAQEQQLETAKMSSDAQANYEQQQREDARQASEESSRLQELAQQERGQDERTAATLESHERTNTQDNLTAVKISAGELEEGHKSKLSTGTGINPSGD